MRSTEVSGRAKAKHELVGALAGWDNEGGSVQPSADAQALLGEVEERILRRLGASVIVQWNDLPTEIQRRLFQHAAAMGEPRHATQLKEEIARFLHKHKNDEAAKASLSDGRARAWSAEPPRGRIERIIKRNAG
jgi:hypothetical protein